MYKIFTFTVRFLVSKSLSAFPRSICHAIRGSRVVHVYHCLLSNRSSLLILLRHTGDTLSDCKGNTRLSVLVRRQILSHIGVHRWVLRPLHLVLWASDEFHVVWAPACRLFKHVFDVDYLPVGVSAEFLVGFGAISAFRL